MSFKINLSTKDGKTFKLEADANELNDKKLGDKIEGSLISPDLAGYELEIMGASDKSGFTAMKDIEGVGLKKVLLNYGKAMHKKPKGDKKINRKPTGLRLRKTVRGNTISEKTSQINIKVLKDGTKTLAEIFPDQNKIPEPEPKPEETSAQTEQKEEVKKINSEEKKE